MKITFEKCEFPVIVLGVPLGLFIIIAVVLLCKFKQQVWSLCVCFLRCRRRSEYESFSDESICMGTTCNNKDCISRFERLKAVQTDLLNTVKSQKEETEAKNNALNRLSRLEESYQNQLKTIGNLRDELKTKEDKNRALEEDLKKERDDKDEALKRLSAIMSSRLRDGNPNVVDLSDQNRPLKVGEQFSELYDNQWTDAFTVVKETVRDTEDRIISMLMEILEECFKTCQTAAADQLSQLRSNVKAITEMVTKKGSKLPEDLMQRIKEERKLNAIDSLPEYHEVTDKIKEYLNNHGIQDTSFIDDPIVEAYIRECIKLCYLMVNQDPPMAIVSRPEQNAGENFKAYQHRGSKLLFVVWPALYLQEGGPLVSKGVAEFGE